jgi:mRNA-degrading endonuclease RelE of RelBE toxin-antitoxin system
LRGWPWHCRDRLPAPISRRQYAKLGPISLRRERRPRCATAKRNQALPLRRAIADLLADPFRGHALHLDLSGFRSYRVKGYRVLYLINGRDACMEIYYVGRRRDVYESFLALLAKNNR